MLRAKRWGLPYREVEAIVVDPAASEIVTRAESEHLSALPLENREDGPVFAVVEPSEERFAAVRELAGTDVTFIVVSQATFDLLSAEVYGMATVNRRPSLFRGRGSREPARTVSREAVTEAPGPDQTRARRPMPVSIVQPEPEAEPEPEPEFVLEPEPVLELEIPVAAPMAAPASADAVENLIHQITAGTASLTAEVAQLTDSLEVSQRELYETREQLAEAQLANAGHDDIVAALRAEVDELRSELSESQAWNASITSRLQDVVQALAIPQPAAEQG